MGNHLTVEVSSKPVQTASRQTKGKPAIPGGSFLEMIQQVERAKERPSGEDSDSEQKSDQAKDGMFAKAKQKTAASVQKKKVSKKILKPDASSDGSSEQSSQIADCLSSPSPVHAAALTSISSQRTEQKMTSEANSLPNLSLTQSNREKIDKRVQAAGDGIEIIGKTARKRETEGEGKMKPTLSVLSAHHQAAKSTGTSDSVLTKGAISQAESAETDLSPLLHQLTNRVVLSGDHAAVVTVTNKNANMLTAAGPLKNGRTSPLDQPSGQHLSNASSSYRSNPVADGAAAALNSGADSSPAAASNMADLLKIIHNGQPESNAALADFSLTGNRSSSSVELSELDLKASLNTSVLQEPADSAQKGGMPLRELARSGNASKQISDLNEKELINTANNSSQAPSEKVFVKAESLSLQGSSALPPDTIAAKQMNSLAIWQSFQNKEPDTASSAAGQVAEKLADWLGGTSLQTTGQGERTMTMTLYPENLGQVTIAVIQNGNELTARLTAQTKAAKELLQSGADQLQSDLSNQGWNVQNIEIHHMPAQATGKEQQEFADERQQSGQQQEDGRDHARHDRQQAPAADSLDGGSLSFGEWIMEGGT